MSLDHLNRLTRNFDKKFLIGEGSYGRVYYATMEGGQKIAIKKLDSSDDETSAEFATQVKFSADTTKLPS